MTTHNHEQLCSDCQKPITMTEHEHCHSEQHRETLEDIIHLQQDNMNYFKELQENLAQRQSAEELCELQTIQNRFNLKIRPLIETAREELCQHGFHTGISEETVTFNQDGNETSFVVGLIMHMADLPVSDNSLVSNNIHSSNLIRFYRVDDSSEIECQFRNSKMQSRIYPLNYIYEDDHEADHSSHHKCKTSIAVQVIIDDFIRYILLSRRAEMTSVV